MQVGTVIHGFKVIRERALSELSAMLWEMEHEKTGAVLCWLDRKDENKAFSIAFKTLPEDSTGVFHILEHSVLCGSDKYPVKEPFVELLKSSVQTFLNAMTFADKTVYPVSSRNDRDFLNLVDIYLDAVLHPAIYRKPEIFRQEGWHYEPGEQYTYQGVVLNEMKGAFAAPQTVLENGMNALLFPDNCYRFVSGGDPEHIPDLTYEQFIATHQKYYHPSNARISLVGSVDIEAALAKIDGFLSAFDRREADFFIPMQKPVDAVEQVIPYEIGAEEPTEQRTIFSCGTLLSDFQNTDRNLAASVLCDYLAGDSDAPLKRAILDAGLGQDCAVSIQDGLQQSTFSWTVWNTDEDKIPGIRKTVKETIERILSDGLDQQRLSACYNAIAFHMRDRDGGGAPRSVNETLEMLEAWNYGGDPAKGLLVENDLKAIHERLNTDYFADLLKELFLDNAHTVTVVLVPSQTLGFERQEKEDSRIAAERAAWSKDQEKQVVSQAEALKRWQQTPDASEATATIPVLALSDLNTRPEPLSMTVTEKDGNTVLRHALVSRIVRFNLIFNAADTKPEELPILALLCEMLGTFKTKRHGSEELQLLVKERIGRLEIDSIVLPGSDPKHCRLKIDASVACIPEQADAARALVTEILTETVFEDCAMLKEKIRQLLIGAQTAVTSNGNSFAMQYVTAYFSAQGVVRERMRGIAYAEWLKQRNEADESTLSELLFVMQTIANRVFTRSRLTVSCSDNLDEAILSELLSGFPDGAALSPDEAVFAPLGARREGIKIPAAVGFAAKGGNLKRFGMEEHGSIPVLANVLNYGFLWNEIRVQGGAYGCGFAEMDGGDICFYSYRDPQPGRSLDVMERAAGFVRSLCQEQPDLTGFILGSVSSVDPLLTDAARMLIAENRFFRGIDDAAVCKRYTELIHTTPDDLLTLCSALDGIVETKSACVIAGQDQLDACGERLDTIKSI